MRAAIRLDRAASQCAWVVTLGMLVAPSWGIAAGPERTGATKPSKAAKGALQEKAEAIDALLQSSWESGGVKPSAIASDSEYMRRAYVDILGRIPNVSEALDFLTTKDPNKRAKLVDGLLEHPDYSKNFASVWTVTLVGRRDQGREVNRKALTDWLRTQFKENVAWDKMAYSLITATGSNRDNGACNFTLSHMEDGAVPLTSISMRVFMGQQVQCTQCHDHPSNDWKQADFWGINAFYKGLQKETIKKIDGTGAEVDDYVELSEEPSDKYSTYERRNAMVGIAFPRFLDGTAIGQGVADDEGNPIERRKKLGEMVTATNNDQFARALVNRLWSHFLGHGFVTPVDDFGAHNPANNPELLEHLAGEFKAAKYDLKSLIRLICASRAYNLTSITTKGNDKDDVLFTHQALKPMSPEQLFDSLLTATAAHKAGGAGDLERNRAEWLRQFQFAYATDEGEESSSYQGTIPQALMMMNGPLMDKAVNGQSGSFLASLLGSADSKRDPAGYVVDRMYLAALGRHPSAKEVEKAAHYYHNDPDSICVMQDLFWALLNSNEFILNH